MTQAYIAAISEGVTALGTGDTERFLQTTIAPAVRKIVNCDQAKQRWFTKDLSYAEKSGHLTDLLKKMNDEARAHLTAVTQAEENALKQYQEWMAAEKDKVTVLTVTIESTTTVIGELGVQLTQLRLTKRPRVDSPEKHMKSVEKLTTEVYSKLDAEE